MGRKDLEMSTHTTLFNNGDFSLHARLSAVTSPEGGYALTLTSQRQESRNPHEEQVRFFACLEREGLQALADLIEQALQTPRDGASA
jgi:hypothetical protein